MDFDDRGVVSLPKLVGGPRYARPPVVGLTQAPRPPDPDELPLLSERTPEDHALAQELGIEPSPLDTSAASPANGGPAAPERTVPAVHPNGSWTTTGGTIGADARSRRLGLPLFRRRNGRSGAS